MKTETVIQKILTADEGKYLTDGKTFGKTVVLPQSADHTSWREITEKEKEELEAKLCDEAGK